MSSFSKIAMNIASPILFAVALNAGEFIEDPHSQSNFKDVQVTHAYLNLTVDFDKKMLSGYAELTLQNNSKSDILRLDTKDLVIHKVELFESGNFQSAEQFSLAHPKPILGSALEVSIKPSTEKVRIHYTTSSKAAGLQWLTKEQTGSKTMPFLYSQGETTYTRSFIPIQDSPQVRFTYDADITVPAGMMVVMSATNSQKLSETGKYFFTMKQSIPAYLVAIAAGNLIFKETGWRSGVYAEPHLVEKAAKEFSETEKMIAKGVELFGPYLWGRFDVVVMPPSFPIGGMENPGATFINPTVIAGDKSLVNVIAHELVHSWLGNLVTNASWGQAWLNEGFTVFGERAILRALYGDEYANIHAKLGELTIMNSFKEMKPEETWLQLDLTDKDPDDGLSPVSYEKGYSFLSTIEGLTSRERFGSFLREYIDTNKFSSMTTNRFWELLKKKLSADEEKKVDFDSWVNGPWFPSSYTEVQCSVLEEIKKQAIEENGDMFPIAMKAWTTQKWIYYIKHLASSKYDTLLGLEKSFELSKKNAEIKTEWFLKMLDAGYSGLDNDIKAFLLEVGRGKFINPIYKKLKEKGKLDFAKSIFAQARLTYHPLSEEHIETLLNS